MESKLLARWKSASEQDQRLFEQERLMLEISESILEALDEQGLSRANFARRFGFSVGRLDRMLSGAHDLDLRTLADIGWVIGREVRIEFATPGR